MTWRSLFTIAAFASALSACASSPEVEASTKEPRLGSQQDIERQLGRRVRMIGAATNTQYGPCIVDSELEVYLEDYRPFPGNAVGKRVEAFGIVHRDNRLGGFVRSANGKPMVFLRKATYNLLEAAGASSEGTQAIEIATDH